MPLIKRWNFCTYTLSVFSIIVRILSLAERLVQNSSQHNKPTEYSFEYEVEGIVNVSAKTVEVANFAL